MQSLPEPHAPPATMPALRQEPPPIVVNYPDQSAMPDDIEEGGLIEYWHMLRRRRGTLIVAACVGALAGLLITVPQTRIYQVRTSLEIVGLNTNFMNLKEANPLAEGGTSADRIDIQTQIKILQSDALVDRVLAKLKSGELPQADPDRFTSWKKALNLPGADEIDPRELAVVYASKHYNVRAAGQTRIIEITVDSPSAESARAFADTLTNEFIDQSLEARWKSTERTGEWLTVQLEDMRVRLERSEDKLQAYARENGLLFAGEDTNVSEERLKQVQEALSDAQTDRISKQSRWEMASSSPADALPDILNDTNLQAYQTRLTELNQQVAELQETYTPEHTRVKRVQAQIATVEGALVKTRGDILKRIRNEYDEALRRETLLAADYATQRGVVTGEGERSIQYNILKREVDSNRELYDAMLQQMKQASLASALRASNIRVVDPAKLPPRPSRPNIPMSSALGLLAGVLLGAALVVMQERANRTIQEPGESAMMLHLPELGVVPSDDAGSWLSLGKYAARESSSARLGKGLNAKDSGDSPVELVTLQRKPSAAAESFRATLVSILFSSDEHKRPRVMAVTSAAPGEGKTTVVTNLSISVAEVRQKVLVVDADMRKPRIHDIFNVDNERGLRDLLRSTEPLTRETVDAVTKESGVPGLRVLPSGSPSYTAGALMYSTRVPELIEILKREYDTVFIDTPPMLQIPDARVLGRVVDRTILVVRARKTTRDAAIAMRNRLVEDGTMILGTILNDWNPKQSPNGYYGHYSGYYYHKAGDYFKADKTPTA